MRIGFIGIGNMGAPMARCLARAGHEVLAHDRDRAVAEAQTGDGIEAVDLPSAAGAEVVITMLPDGRIVRQVAEEAAPMMADRAVLVDMSTAYPLQTVELRGALPQRIALVDAPVSGGVRRAVSGTLTIMAGGEPADLDRVAPILVAMGTVSRTGPLGSGHATKLLNNYLSASGLAAACEAVMIGRKFGLDPDLMADVFNTSTGKNNATEVKLKQHVNNRAFASGFTLGLMAKDLTLARQLAEDLEVSAEGLMACASLYAEAAEDLGPDADHTEVLKVLETR